MLLCFGMNKMFFTLQHSFLMQEGELDSLRDGIEAVDQNRPPLKVVSRYFVLDHLGTGAFGSVFKVWRLSSCRSASAGSLLISFNSFTG